MKIIGIVVYSHDDHWVIYSHDDHWFNHGKLNIVVYSHDDHNKQSIVVYFFLIQSTSCNK